MIDIINNIYEKHKNIEYGWKDKKGIVHNHIDDDYVKNFHFQTPEELILSNTGNCWETVELTRQELQKNNIPCDSYFFVIPYGHFFSHSILVANINNKYYWIENSLENFKGIREYNSLEELFYFVLNNFNVITINKPFKYKDIKIFKYLAPKEHISCLRFYFHCFNGKNITKKYLPNYLKLIIN